jgi:hypothetical protein
VRARGGEGRYRARFELGDGSSVLCGHPEHTLGAGKRYHFHILLQGSTT